MYVQLGQPIAEVFPVFGATVSLISAVFASPVNRGITDSANGAVSLLSYSQPAPTPINQSVADDVFAGVSLISFSQPVPVSQSVSELLVAGVSLLSYSQPIPITQSTSDDTQTGNVSLLSYTQ